MPVSQEPQSNIFIFPLTPWESSFSPKTLQNPSKQESINAKINHIRDVVEITTNLINLMGGKIEGTNEEWNKPLAQTIADYHDIARFEELNGNDRINQKFRHARAGAKKILGSVLSKSNPIPFLKHKEIRTIHHAVLHHSEIKYKGNSPYAHLLRDADKIALCQDVDLLCKVMQLYEKLEEGNITENAWQEFSKTGFVSNENVHTLADGLLRQFTWYDDLHFEASKRMWQEKQIRQKIIEKMKEKDVGSEYLKKLEEKITP